MKVFVLFPGVSTTFAYCCKKYFSDFSVIVTLINLEEYIRGWVECSILREEGDVIIREDAFRVLLYA